MIYRTSSAHEEGGERLFSVNTERFVDDGHGNVKALLIHEVELVEGRFRKIEGTDHELPADLVLLAMGFLGPEKGSWLERLGVDFDERGNIRRDGDFMTNVPGVFVAGDMGRGQSLIVWAIAEGRACAAGVDRYLVGETTLPSPVLPTHATTRVTPDTGGASASATTGPNLSLMFVRAGAAVVACVSLCALTSCSEDGSGASASTVEIQPSSYVVKDPVTTTTAPVVPPGPDEEGLSAGEQSFTIQSSNDVPWAVAQLYGIDLEELRNYNGWDENFSDYPGIGEVVRIPPGAKFIDPSVTTTTAAGDDEEDDRRRDRRDDRRDDGDAWWRPVQPDLRRRERRRPARDHAQVRHHARAAQ